MSKMPDRKISNFTRFMVPGLDLLEPYASPDDEVSVFKSVPISLLDQARAVLRQAGRLEGQQFRIIYRGPRSRYLYQASTWRQDARAFSVYTR